MVCVDMNRSHVRVWLGPDTFVDFELPKGRRPKFWTVLRSVAKPRALPRSSRRRP